MADTKITGLLSPQVTTNPATDVLPIVNIADTLMASSGSTRKITVNQLLGAGGTATLASATITGDLTVNTNVLKVDSTNDRVGINTASPSVPLEIYKASGDSKMRITSGSNTLTVGWDDPNGFYYTANTALMAWQLSTGTAMTLNSTGLGVGVTPVSGSGKFQTVGGATYSGEFDIISALTNVSPALAAAKGVLIGYNNTTNNGIISAAYGSGTEGLQFWTHNGSSWGSRMTLDATGNVGIGVTPSAWDTANYKALQVSRTAVASLSNIGIFSANWFADTGGDKYIATGTAARIDVNNGGQIQFKIAPSGTAGNAITFTQAMTLDASGRLLVNTTSVIGGSGDTLQIAGKTTAATDYCSMYTGTSTTVYGSRYYHTSAVVGSITFTASGTAYNIASDYRLKESVQPLTGGLARINALKPSIYKWKVNNSNGEGFIAHELADVVPAAVTGEKDAVNEDGSIKPQQVDLSKIVPILVAAIKELSAEVNALKNA